MAHISCNSDFKITSANKRGWVEVIVTNPSYTFSKKKLCRDRACVKRDSVTNTCSAYGGFLWFGRSTKKYVSAAECRLDAEGRVVDEITVADVSTEAGYCTDCNFANSRRNDLRGVVEELVANAQAIQEQVVSPVGAVLPLRGNLTITRTYGRQHHPVTHTTRNHWGLDIVSDNPDVINVLPGRIIKIYEAASAGNRRGGVWPYRGFGNIVIVEVNVDGEIRQIRYSHLAKYSVPNHLKVGSIIPAGMVIGKMGATGLVTGVHLDLSYCTPGSDGICRGSDGEFINPAELFGDTLLNPINKRNLSLWEGN